MHYLNSQKGWRINGMDSPMGSKNVLESCSAVRQAMDDVPRYLLLCQLKPCCLWVDILSAKMNAKHMTGRVIMQTNSNKEDWEALGKLLVLMIIWACAICWRVIVNIIQMIKVIQLERLGKAYIMQITTTTTGSSLLFDNLHVSNLRITSAPPQKKTLL